MRKDMEVEDLICMYIQAVEDLSCMYMYSAYYYIMCNTNYIYEVPNNILYLYVVHSCRKLRMCCIYLFCKYNFQKFILNVKHSQQAQLCGLILASYVYRNDSKEDGYMNK